MSGEGGGLGAVSWEEPHPPALTQAGHRLGGVASGKDFPVMGRKSLFWHQAPHFRSRSQLPDLSLWLLRHCPGPAWPGPAPEAGTILVPSGLILGSLLPCPGKQWLMPYFKEASGRVHSPHQRPQVGGPHTLLPVSRTPDLLPARQGLLQEEEPRSRGRVPAPLVTAPQSTRL